MEKLPKIKVNFLDRFNLNFINISLQDYKDSVLRDIYFLISSFSHLSDDELDDGYKHVKTSVLTHGLRSFVGHETQSLKKDIIEEIKTAIIKFEPRIKSRTLEIEEYSAKGINMKLLIKGDLIVPTTTNSINLALNIDLETGHISIDKSTDPGNRNK